MPPPTPPSPSPAPKPRRTPSAATRWSRRARELRVLDALKRGAALEAIANAEGLTPRRMRDIVNGLLETHGDLAPADGLAQMRERRLEQALDLAAKEVKFGSTKAIGQMIRLLREYEHNSEAQSRPGRGEAHFRKFPEAQAKLTP